MTATKRSPNCDDCDCCLIYKSNFCEQLVAAGSSLTYLGDEWDDDNSTGGESWQISTTDGGCVDLNCPDIDKPFASGLYHVSLDDRLAILKQRIPTAYHASVDFELFYDSGLPTSNYNIGLEVFWDFAGTNRYGSVRVSFDYGSSTGSGGGYSLKIEVISSHTGVETVIGEFWASLPSGVENYRGTLKLGLVEAPTGCDNPVLCVTLTGDSASASRAFPVSLRYPDLDTTQFAIATAYSAYAAATTFDCDGVVTSIPQHVRVYEVFIERDESQKEECETCSWGCCKCGIPLEFDVTFTGFVDYDCDVCDEFNNTFTLSFIGNQQCIRDSISQYYNCCRWRYTASDYGSIGCTFYDGSTYTYVVGFQYIDLSSVEYTPSNATWELEIVANITVYYGDSTNPWNEEGRRRCRKVWTRTESAWVPNCSFNGTESWTEESGCISYIGDQNSSSVVTNSIWSILCNTIGTPSVEVG